MKKYYLSLLVVISLLTSCYPTQKNLDYFSYPAHDSSHLFIHESFEVPIKAGDQLSITLTSLKPEYAVPYTVPGGRVTVDGNGYILYPQLGSIKAVDLTRNQLRDAITNRLKNYLVDPVVSVDFLNFKITVLGEVARQGTITVPDAKINILEAIAQSGDITSYGRKDQVIVIREKNGMREFGYVNLLSHDFFTSPYYRLQQNDFIYVRPSENKPSVSEQTFLRKLSFATTILGVVTTLTFLILNFTRK